MAVTAVASVEILLLIGFVYLSVFLVWMVVVVLVVVVGL